MAPHLIMTLMAPLVSFGFHPPALKKSDGIVLDNAGKASYDCISSFRIIVLLQTFSKVLERVITGRLSSAARVVGLINPH